MIFKIKQKHGETTDWVDFFGNILIWITNIDKLGKTTTQAEYSKKSNNSRKLSICRSSSLQGPVLCYPSPKYGKLNSLRKQAKTTTLQPTLTPTTHWYEMTRGSLLPNCLYINKLTNTQKYARDASAACDRKIVKNNKTTNTNDQYTYKWNLKLSNL